MPRAVGQIDTTKREAILDAAAAVFAEAGFNAPLERISREACVSKQTLYNHFGGREALIRALVERRRLLVTAALDAPNAAENLEETLTRFAAALVQRFTDQNAGRLLRLVVGAASEHPDHARLIYQEGVVAVREQLAQFLRIEHDRGNLDIPNANDAAEMFSGMVNGQLQLATLLGVDRSLSAEALESRAQECAKRFIRAYKG